MDLYPYVEALRQQLATVAQAGGEETTALAERLTAPLEAATRLVLLEALSAAASEITCDLAPDSVELRLRGSDPEFVVTLGQGRATAEAGAGTGPNTAPPVPMASSDADDGSTSRITLRLPEQLKVRVEEAAVREGLSVNAWLVRSIMASLDTRSAPGGAPAGRSVGERFTGWVR